MLETFFQRSFAMRRLRHGPLAGHIDLLANRLAAEGYSRVHSRIQLRHIGHFNRWFPQEHLSVEQLDENIIERYWRSFMREKRVRPKDVFALQRASRTARPCYPSKRMSSSAAWARIHCLLSCRPDPYCSEQKHARP